MDKRQDLEPPAVQEGAAHTVSQPGPEPLARDAIAVDIEADPTLGYASIQNAVPIVRSLRLTNRSQDTFENLEVHVRCNPAFAQPVRLRFDVLVPGEIRRISPLDLTPDHAYLADLQESQRASIDVVVQTGGRKAARNRPARRSWAAPRSPLPCWPMTNGPACAPCRNCWPRSRCRTIPPWTC